MRLAALLPSSNIHRELYILAAEPGVRARAKYLKNSAQCIQSHVYITGSSLYLEEIYNDNIDIALIFLKFRVQ
jgi:hypothetical protein